MSYLSNPGDNLTEAQQAAILSFIALSTTPTGYHLAKDASGNFVNTADTGGGAMAGGTDGQVQYNNASGLGGITGATYNGTKLNLLSSTVEFSDGTDPTKKTILALNAISTATTVTLTVPNQSGTIALLTDIPKINQVLDTNGNKILTFTTVGSAVNYVDIKDAATGTYPTFTASGTDANIGFNFVTKGTGTFQVNGSTVALDSNVMHLTGNETAAGLKTFSNLSTFSAGFNTYFGMFSGGNAVGSLALNQQIFQYNGGGYNHYITSQHNAGTGNNQLRFFLNNSATSGGSSAPNTGNTEVLRLDDANGVDIYKGLQINDANLVAKYGGKDKFFVRGFSGAGGRASQQDMIATHASDNTNIRFTWYADRDSAVVGNDTLQLWAYPGDNAGSIIDLAQIMTLYYDRISGKTTFDMQRDKEWAPYTPVIAADSGAVTSYSVQSGAYKKIGSTVHFRCKVRVSDWGTASGGFSVSLPIVANANARGDMPLCGFAADVATNPATANKGFPVVDGSGNISFLGSVDTGRVIVSGCTTNTVFRITGSYEV